MDPTDDNEGKEMQKKEVAKNEEGRQRDPDSDDATVDTGSSLATKETSNLPDDRGTEETENDGTTKDTGASSGNGAEQCALGTEIDNPINDVPKLKRATVEFMNVDMTMGHAPEGKLTKGGTEGECACCTKVTQSLQICEPCGQFFHEECITYVNAQKQCCVDNALRIKICFIYEWWERRI